MWVLSAIFGLLLVCTNAYAYPEFISKGYVSCKTCHVTAHGGSPLSAYGRSLAGELSTFGGPNLSIGNEDYHIGASFRAIQLRKKFPSFTVDDYFLMQKEVQGYMKARGLTAGGRNESYFVQAGELGLAISYRHAKPTFGLNIENHTTKVRRLWTETDYLEVSIANKSVEVFVGSSPNFVSGKFAALFDWGRVGFSLHSKEIYALTAIVKVFDGLAAMAELNTKNTYGKVSWNFLPGFWFYTQLDDLTPGIGLKWMPIRHLEFDSLLETNRYWALCHLYF